MRIPSPFFALLGVVPALMALHLAPPAARAETVPAATGAPSLDELKNATFRGFDEPAGPVTLSGGRWEGKPYVQGGASLPVVTLADDFRLVGDLDGDGSEEAVVLLAQSSGGTGEFIYLAAVDRKDGQPHNVATTLLGDRVDVRDGKIEKGRITLDVVQPGDRDARCCPGDLVTRSWTLASAKLKEGTPARTGRLSPDTLAGTEWVLRRWAWNESAPGEPGITLRFADGRFAGSAGCNSYTASVQAGKQPGDISVGPAAATRKMCPEPAMGIESRFLSALGAVEQFSFRDGRLVLTYPPDGKTLLFDRAPAR